MDYHLPGASSRCRRRQPKSPSPPTKGAASFHHQIWGRSSRWRFPIHAGDHIYCMYIIISYPSTENKQNRSVYMEVSWKTSVPPSYHPFIDGIFPWNKPSSNLLGYPHDLGNISWRDGQVKMYHDLRWGERWPFDLGLLDFKLTILDIIMHILDRSWYCIYRIIQDLNVCFFSMIVYDWFVLWPYTDFFF